MSLQSRLLTDTVQLAEHDHVLFLNSAADPFVASAAQQLHTGTITLAEDNIASLHMAMHELAQSSSLPVSLQHVAFHEYTSHEPAGTIDIAIMNILYQPGNTWIHYALRLAAYALKPGGRLYVLGAKDRGILSVAKRMQETFGNVATLAISKGQRVVCSRQSENKPLGTTASVATSINDPSISLLPLVFADGKLDEGTRLLIDALQVHPDDTALDIGCGAGFIGLHIAHLAAKGHVTMVDVSLATVAVAQRRVAASGLANITVLPSDGAQAVLSQRFDLVVTNPPFHQGGIQTTAIAERFIGEAAQVLRPRGRFYLVANRFLKYEPTLRAHFKELHEVGGNTRYKVLQATSPH
ncbi:MAG: methyltransferase [Ktedonobacteraceae bacterium]